MKETPLAANWQFRNATPGVGYWRPNEPANPWRPAVVPGNVHDDLVRNGMLADPFVRENEAGAQWVGEEDWVYRTTFEWHPEPALPNRRLCFDGLDTVCEIRLNGEPLPRHDSMFCPHECDVTDRLREGVNELEVGFESAVRVGMERRRAFFEAHGIRHDTNWFDERAFVRKVQSMSGWDWGPRLVSCGIWRAVRMVEYSARIRSFAVFQERRPDGSFRVWSETVVEGEANLETEFDGARFEGDFDVVVDSPRLWWPHGEGEAHLYRASARIDGGPETVRRIGLRTIELLRAPDDLGESFEFAVNGRRIVIRGANWIPNDAFPSRISREDEYRQIEACAALNMNMLRVWGGGLYESDGFYDACDELGILVWQDFAYGCSYYPDGPAEQAVAAQEAEAQVRRLRDRTCLTLWCGNNENDVMWQSRWGGLELSPPRYFGDPIYGSVLAEVCARLDPTRPYLRSSPIGRHEEDKAWGDEHYWDVWHGRGDWTFYADSNTRFSSEFGFASACGVSAWRRAEIEPDQATPDDLPVRWHDKTNKAFETFVSMVELHYPPANTLDDWIYTSQLNQRDALRFGIEHYRTNAYCRGTLIWQFNDCWPVQSWAVQDYARELKVAGFELERLYRAVLLSLRVSGSEVELWIVNDLPQVQSIPWRIQLISVRGSVIEETGGAAEWASGERRLAIRLDAKGLDPAETVMRAWVEGVEGTETWRTLGEPKAMHWQPASLSRKDGALHVHELAYDWTVEIADEPGQPVFAGEDRRGLRAICALDATLPLRVEAAERRLRIRTLTGSQHL